MSFHNRKNNGNFMKTRHMINRSRFQPHQSRVPTNEKYDKHDKLKRSKMIMRERYVAALLVLDNFHSENMHYLDMRATHFYEKL